MKRTLGELLAAADGLPAYSPSRRSVQQKAVRAVRYLVEQKGAFCPIACTEWREWDHLRGCGEQTIEFLRQVAHELGDSFPTEVTR